MFVTVGICTWNRARLLDQTLAQMKKLCIPPGVEWELLVVNNNCTDNTDEVIKRYADQLPVRRLFVASPGKSHALNSAIDAARGELILWTDDDVLVDPNWLAAYVQAANNSPRASFFGGPIKPWFEGSPPRWLTRVLARVETAFAVRDFGPAPVPLTQDQHPFGANWAVRTETQKKYRYDPSLGPKPNSSVRHEETAVLTQMVCDGLEGLYVPAARVDHFIPKWRQTTKYLRSFYLGQGVYQARIVDDLPGTGRLFGRPRWLWRAVIEAEVKYRLARCFRRPEVWIESLVKCAFTWGRLYGSKDRLNPDLVPKFVLPECRETPHALPPTA